MTTAHVGGFPWRAKRCVHCGNLAVASNSNGEVCAEHINSDRQNMAITHHLPKPPAGHPWHQANDTARDLSKKFQELRSKQGKSPESNEAFNAFYVANKIADDLLDEWKIEYRAKFQTIREHLGPDRWPAFWAALPDGDAMVPVIDQALAEINGGGRVISIHQS